MSFLFSSKSFKTFSVLDVGSSKFACLIAKPSADTISLQDNIPMVSLLGFGYKGAKGIQLGSVTDIEAMENAILSCVQVAEKEANETIREVYVSIPPSLTRSCILEASVDISNKIIDEKDIKKILNLDGNAFPNFQILHAFPISYSIDDIKNIKDPKGMSGKTLSVKLYVIMSGVANLRALQTAINRCQLDVAGYVSSVYGASLSTLFEDEKDFGVTVLDVGSHQTGICCFLNGSVVFHHFLPYGGSQITNDIAKGLLTPKNQAERLKTLYGNLNNSEKNEAIYVAPIDNEKKNHPTQVPKHLLSHIIRSRMEEILELIKNFTKETAVDPVVFERFVLTGGGMQLNGSIDLAYTILNSSVRLGVPKRLLGSGSEVLHSPMFSSLIGCLIYAIQDRTDHQLHNLHYKKAGFFGKLKGLFRKES